MNTLLQSHPFADLFPMMTGVDRDELVASMRDQGYDPRQPIILYDEQILDGRNRYAIARELGVEPSFAYFRGTPDEALAYVLRYNLARRHLSTGQRAMLAARLATAKRGGRRKKDEPANLPVVTQYLAASRLGVSERSVRKAIALLKNDPQAAKDVADGKATLKSKRAHVAQASGNDEWYTPDAVLDAAVAAIGAFDLDPASCAEANRRVNADVYWSKKTDGLREAWPDRLMRESGERERGPITVWLNPPYSNPTPWIEQLIIHVEQGNIRGAIVLVNNATETPWCQRLFTTATAVCFPSTRIRFVRPGGKDDGNPLQGQAIFYYGDEPQAFARAFASIGCVGLLERVYPTVRTMPREPAKLPVEKRQTHLPIVDEWGFDDDDPPEGIEPGEATCGISHGTNPGGA